MNFFVNINTIGKKCTPECIKSLRDAIPKNDDTWIIHANIVRTPLVTKRYIETIDKLVDQITITTINWCHYFLTLPALYFSADYIANTGDDCWYYKDSIKGMIEVMKDDPMLGAIGGHSEDKKSPDILMRNDPNWFPDLGVFYSKKAFNTVGGIIPLFPYYGQGELELQCRMNHAGYNIYYMDEYCYHDREEKHTGRDMVPDMELFDKQDRTVFNWKKEHDFPVEQWWKSDPSVY